MMNFTDCEQILSNMQQSEETIYFFGLSGLKDFISTGNWPGIPDTYFHVETLEQRKQFVEVFHQHLLKKTKKFRLLKDEKSGDSVGMRFDLVGKKKLIISSRDFQLPHRFITISEPGICDAFRKYFEHLMESGVLYSQEDTIIKFEEMLQHSFL
jgi:hypothetical protein